MVARVAREMAWDRPEPPAPRYVPRNIVPRPIVIDGDADPHRLCEVIDRLATIHGVDEWRLAAPVEAGAHVAWNGRSRTLIARRDKGLEFDAVAVDTSLEVRSMATHTRELYTLLTRSTRVLVIVASTTAPAATCALLEHLDRDFVRFHDSAARSRFDEMVSRRG
jgi:hypothetical protein